MQTLKTGTLWKDTITRLPASAPLSDMEAVLREDGTVIIEDLLDPDTLEQVNTDLDPVLLGPQLGMQDQVAVLGRTVRFNATLSQSPILAHEVADHPALVGSAEAILGDYTDTLQLAALPASEVTPGEEPQRLHRDDWNWGHARNRDHPWSVFSHHRPDRVHRRKTAPPAWSPAVIGGKTRTRTSISKATWHEGIYEEKSIPHGQYADLEIPAEMRPGSGGDGARHHPARRRRQYHPRCTPARSSAQVLPRVAASNRQQLPPVSTGGCQRAPRARAATHRLSARVQAHRHARAERRPHRAASWGLTKSSLSLWERVGVRAAASVRLPPHLGPLPEAGERKSSF